MIDSGPSWPSGTTPFSEKRRARGLWTYGFLIIAAIGILLRVAVTIAAGNAPRTPWGGGGDTPGYILLAQNLIAGKGYTYAGMPTAYRPPFYPAFLAVCVRAFHGRALEAARWIQLFAGLGAAFLCAAAAGRLCDSAAKKAALVVVLFFPTLVDMSGEILTETLAALCTALLLYLLVRYIQQPRWSVLIGMSVTVGVAALIRFNMALFGFVILWVVLTTTSASGLPRWRAAALAIFLPVLIVSPWLIRNLIVFDGSLIFTTESGPAAAMGILAPEGRALPGDSERLRAALGWLPPMEIETNDERRDLLPSESVLNRDAWRVSIHLWKVNGWKLVPLTIEKLGYFWLSTDQLLSTSALAFKVRIARAAGVVGYWILLALGIAGWFELRKRHREFAAVVALYAILITILHLPFNMNTRLRTPFMDPWIAVLAGIGLIQLRTWIGSTGLKLAGDPPEAAN
ncbi:MAG: glycosyltransferase family 39 protein [Candidatus Acidiferrales bacterium]